MNAAQKEKIEDLRLGRKAFAADYEATTQQLDMIKQDMTRAVDRLQRTAAKLASIDHDLEDAVMAILVDTLSAELRAAVPAEVMSDIKEAVVAKTLAPAEAAPETPRPADR